VDRDQHRSIVTHERIAHGFFVVEVAKCEAVVEELSEFFPGVMPRHGDDKDRWIISEPDLLLLRQLLDTYF